MTICILLPAPCRRKAKFATPCTYARCPHQSLRLLLPTNRALFRPAKILSAGTSRCADLRGPLKQHHPKISCSRAYSYPLGRLPFLTVIKMDSYISSAAVCNISAPIRPSAVRNSNKNLLLLGVFLPSRTLAFLTLIKRCSYISAAAICQYVYYRLCVARAKVPKRIALRLVRIIQVRHKIIFRDGHKI